MWKEFYAMVDRYFDGITLADQASTETADTWVFEDAVHAAVTAYRAGYPVAGVADAYSDQEELKKVCHLYLPDLTDFDGFWARAQTIKL